MYNLKLYKGCCRMLIGWAAVVLLISFYSCKKNAGEGVPVILEVRNYAASPNDTTVHTINTGQWVVLVGKNLNNAVGVMFGSIPAKINSTYFDNEHLVVQVPDIPFQNVARENLNKITVISDGGSATFDMSIVGAPIITAIRNAAPAPKDTLLRSLLPGMKISIIGYNLKGATNVSFQGVAANLAGAVYTDTSIVIDVPVDLSVSNASLVNTVTYTTNIGVGTFSVRIVGPPVITAVSNENPAAGDSVYLYGNNFVGIARVSFANAVVTAYKVSEDGTTIGFKVPALTQSGPVTVKTLAGEFSSAYNVNDVVSGVISNFEWGNLFRWDWWGGASLTSGNPDFPGNTSQYLSLVVNPLNSGAGDEFTTAIRISGAPWLAASSVGDPLSRWALKFELNVPVNWNGGTLCIQSSNKSYMVRFEPWQITSTATASYNTKGWKTITIPLSSFRKKDEVLGDGRGTPVSSIIELLGASGSSDLLIYLHNYGNAQMSGKFSAAFDNFRVVQR